MTEPLFRINPYLPEADSVVRRVTADGGIVLAESLFYPTGGGQPGDIGALTWESGLCQVIATEKGAERDIVLRVEGAATPGEGMQVRQVLDWDRRHAHMRMHTALHLLSVVIPLPVSGGAIGAQKGRLDFDMPDAPEDREAIEAALNGLIARDLPVSESWITDDQLAANPDMVKTMSVKPPTGAGHVRLIGIGEGETQVDLQPCGGTHVARTGEIGRVRLGKIEKKGKQNRRVSVHFA